MFDQFRELTIKKNDQELVFVCMVRCRNALESLYRYEEANNKAFWDLDNHFFEQHMAVMYERFSYAMSLILNKFCEEHIKEYGRRDAQDGCINFEVVINTCTDTVFKKSVQLGGFMNGIKYYLNGYESKDYTTDSYDRFWVMNKLVMQDIVDTRRSFEQSERTWRHGFSTEKIEADMLVYEKDFLHIKKIIELVGEPDVKKFLHATKKIYLPMAIDAFSKPPKQQDLSPFNIKTEKAGKWWQLWK